MSTADSPSAQVHHKDFADISLNSQRAWLAINDHVGPLRDAVTPEKLARFVSGDGDETPQSQAPGSDGPSDLLPVPPFKVAIVGAGAAGLFTAMLFDYLKEKYHLNVEYHIIEARAEDRVGGRLYTYKFGAKQNQPPIGPHDYYDVGAMRFPDHKIMERTFKLFKTLNMGKLEQPSNGPDNIKKGQLIPYILTSDKQPTYYNGHLNFSGGTVTAKAFEIPGLPSNYQNTDASVLISKAIQKFLTAYENGIKKENMDDFWTLIRETADGYTVRQYLMEKHEEQYDYNTVEFLETVAFGDGWFNQSLTEVILQTIDFTPPPVTTPPKWWCVEEGVQLIAKKMLDKITQKNNIKFKTKVVGMSYTDSAKREKIKVLVSDGKANTEDVYDAVFNSAPLGAMQHMNLDGLQLSWKTKSAIRSLNYGASCKVGVRFSKLWWIKECGIVGGQGKTDLPIRNCVYPSYNVNDPTDQPGVLLVSYSWAHGAQRLRSLISRESPKAEEELKELLIHDLTLLHAGSEETKYKALYKIISESYLDHYAFDWGSDPNNVGAFAYFGPGQFANMYPGISANDGKHIIIGEAASAHHGWVVGALDSAVRGIYQFVFRHKAIQSAENVLKAYDGNKVDEPWGPLPDEYKILTKPFEPQADAPKEPGKPPKEYDVLTEPYETPQADVLTEPYEPLKAVGVGETGTSLAQWQVVGEMARLAQGTDELDMDLIDFDDLESLLPEPSL